MASLNRVFLLGNLTRDPEMRYVPSGMAVTSFSLAVSRVFNLPSGERKEETCFVRITVWGKQAETCNQYLKKGRPVLVEGRLQYRAWETQEGEKRSTLEVRADRVQFLGAPKTEGQPAAAVVDHPAVPGEAGEEAGGGVPPVEESGSGRETVPF